MNEDGQRRYEKLKKDFEKELNKRVNRERKDILDSVISIAPEVEKYRKKIMDVIEKKDLDNKNKRIEDSKIIEMVEYVCQRGDNFVYKDSQGRLWNEKSQLVGYCKESNESNNNSENNDNKYIFYDKDSNIEQKLKEDEEKLKQIYLNFNS